MQSRPLLSCVLSLHLCLAAACGSSDSSRRVPREAGAEGDVPSAGGREATGGAKGTGGAPGAGGARATGGNGGRTAGGAAGASSAGGESAAGGTAPLADARAGDASDASADGTAEPDASLDGATADGAPTYTPGIDAGAGCAGPVNEVVITPESASLPSAGLVLWLRGDRSVYKTAANEVCAWVNQTAAHTVFTPGTTRPTWDGAGVNAQASVHFGPANSYVGAPGVLGLSVTQARTFVAVQRLTNTAARFQAINMGDFSTPGTFVMLDTNTFQTTGSREGVYVTNNSFDSALATSTSPRLHVLSVDTMTVGTPVAASIHYRVNGAERTLTRRQGTGNFQSYASANFTAIGTGTSTVDVAEVLVYDHALTAGELTTLEAALTARYQLN